MFMYRPSIGFDTSIGATVSKGTVEGVEVAGVDEVEVTEGAKAVVEAEVTGRSGVTGEAKGIGVVGSTEEAKTAAEAGRAGATG